MPYASKEKEKEYNRQYHPGYYAKNKDKILLRQKADAAAVKTQVIRHYGGKCACCGEKTLAFLQLDHIDGGGNDERRKMKTSGGWTFYKKLIKLGYPEGYQVLCANCNSAKGIYGVCPHNVSEWWNKVGALQITHYTSIENGDLIDDILEEQNG